MNIKNKYILPSLIALSILLIACNEHSNEQADDKAKASEEKIELSLNQGEKWEANAETTAGVQAMVSIVNTFKEGNQDQGSYTALKADLENEFALIFKKCTMQGEAHNQLHNFLLPLRKMFTDLTAEDTNTQEQAVNQIEKQLSLYTDYFE